MAYLTSIERTATPGLAYLGVIRPNLSPKRNRGRILRFFRTQNQLSQAEVARRTGIPKQTISRRETLGISDFDEILAISQVLGMTLDDWTIPIGFTRQQP